MAKVVSQGKTVLRLSSAKSLTLTEVLHVPDVWKNLIFGSVLINIDFELVFESKKFGIVKTGIFEGLFKMNVNFVGNKASICPFLGVACSLGHVNFLSIKNMMDLALIPKSKLVPKTCEVCVQSKFTRKPFKSAERYFEF